MEDPVRHADYRFRSRVRAWRWRRALWGGRLILPVSPGATLGFLVVLLLQTFISWRCTNCNFLKQFTFSIFQIHDIMEIGHIRRSVGSRQLFAPRPVLSEMCSSCVCRVQNEYPAAWIRTAIQKNLPTVVHLRSCTQHRHQYALSHRLCLQIVRGTNCHSLVKSYVRVHVQHCIFQH